jgi:hypothetical protein
MKGMDVRLKLLVEMVATDHGFAMITKHMQKKKLKFVGK